MPGPVEFVILLDRHPRHPPAFGGQRVAGSGKGLFLHQKLLRAASHSCCDTTGGVFIVAILVLLSFLKQTEIRSEKSSEPADADRENSSRGSGSGDHCCCVCDAYRAHIALLRRISPSSLPVPARGAQSGTSGIVYPGRIICRLPRAGLLPRGARRRSQPYGGVSPTGMRIPLSGLMIVLPSLLTEYSGARGLRFHHVRFSTITPHCRRPAARKLRTGGPLP